MASPFQQQSVQRKVIYIGLILVLFTAAGVFRKFGVEARAQELSLREQDRAEVPLTDAAIRLSLTGSRGLAVCVLWAYAIEMQKKHQWNELELLIRSVIKLQPHFIEPWKFQSWNLAYNVSVESDRERDQYFYIARGIELLYEGEQQNKNHPDLRFNMAHYTMNKLAQGDKKEVLQSLVQMSCIDLQERSPSRFEKTNEQGRKTLNLEEFEKFCEKHPQLVRRVREKLNRKTPDQIVRFLAENEKIPALYELRTDGRTQLKANPGDRFPLLPPWRAQAYDEEALNDRSNIDEKIVGYVDAFLVAHAWFAYAQEVLPKPHPKVPGRDSEVPLADRARYRQPKFTTILFRMFPARALSYVAERLEKEGWFDNQGWVIDEPGTLQSQKWFPGKTVVVGRYDWGVEFWRRAHEQWRRQGEANLILIPATKEADLENEARPFREAFGLKDEDKTRRAYRENEVPLELRDSWRASEALRELHAANKLSNFPHFYYTSMVEAYPETVQARKSFFEIDHLRRKGSYLEAVKRYEEVLPLWKRLLEENAEFQRDEEIQEDTFIMQMRYLDLFSRPPLGSALKQDLAQHLVQTQVFSALASAPVADPWLSILVAVRVVGQSSSLPDIYLVGPFDGKTKRNEPFISQRVLRQVYDRNPNARNARRW